MDKNEKIRLQLAIDQADTWVKRYQKANSERNAIRTGAAVALKQLKSGVVPVDVNGQAFNVLPLGPGQQAPLANLARFVQLKPVSAADQELLHQLDTEIPPSIAESQRAIASRRVSEQDQESADFLTEYVQWGLHERIPAALDRTTPPAATPKVNLAEALRPENGLGNALRALGTPALLPASEVRSRLATFTAAERYAGLARAITPVHDYVVVCSPPSRTASDLINAIEVND
jgi:hypothetical protein